MPAMCQRHHGRTGFIGPSGSIGLVGSTDPLSPDDVPDDVESVMEQAARGEPDVAPAAVATVVAASGTEGRLSPEAPPFVPTASWPVTIASSQGHVDDTSVKRGAGENPSEMLQDVLDRSRTALPSYEPPPSTPGAECMSNTQPAPLLANWATDLGMLCYQVAWFNMVLLQTLTDSQRPVSQDFLQALQSVGVVRKIEHTE